MENEQKMLDTAKISNYQYWYVLLTYKLKVKNKFCYVERLLWRNVHHTKLHIFDTLNE